MFTTVVRHSEGLSQTEAAHMLPADSKGTSNNCWLFAVYVHSLTAAISVACRVCLYQGKLICLIEGKSIGLWEKYC